MKEELGYTNIESKLKVHRTRKEISDFKEGDEINPDMARSHSAEKFESLIQITENQMPKTNKNFKKKNEEYIEKLKKKEQRESRLRKRRSRRRKN